MVYRPNSICRCHYFSLFLVPDTDRSETGPKPVISGMSVFSAFPNLTAVVTGIVVLVFSDPNPPKRVPFNRSLLGVRNGSEPRPSDGGGFLLRLLSLGKCPSGVGPSQIQYLWLLVQRLQNPSKRGISRHPVFRSFKKGQIDRFETLLFCSF